MELPKEFFTRETIASLTGSALVALLIPSGLMYLIGPRFKPFAKWACFLVSMFLSFAIASTATGATAGAVQTRDLWYWILTVVNGFLIFASALGSNELFSSLQPGTLGGAPLFNSWLGRNG